jgi:hypothetical protein
MVICVSPGRKKSLFCLEFQKNKKNILVNAVVMFVVNFPDFFGIVFLNSTFCHKYSLFVQLN